jgi:hypothetical protein
MAELERELTAHDLWPHFKSCGYKSASILQDLSLPGDRNVAIAGFAQRPFDSRSACFSAIDVTTTPFDDASACREIGAPLTFLCDQDHLLWWSQTDKSPFQVGQSIPKQQLEGFFREHAQDFAPERIYRAKTLGRFEQSYQLSFIDTCLMPVLEREVGETIERLLLESVAELRDSLNWSKQLTLEQGQWLVKVVFWMLGAKMLHDKRVDGFIRLNFSDVDEVFNRLEHHYGDSTENLIRTPKQRRALAPIAERIHASVDLRFSTTEALAYVYENTLISDEIRAELGTHSTPSYLVDYIVGRLDPWIREIPKDRRRVFEPACGHAAFLVAAVRELTSLLTRHQAEPLARKNYLRERICGYDIDAMAVEIARLSLTLTDIPNPNGWSVKVADLFESDLLERTARTSTILLSNTPFQNLTLAQRTIYSKAYRNPAFVNQTAELLYRSLNALPTEGVFGVIVPRKLLHTKGATPFRQLLLENFEIQEICLFPDKVFNFAEQESAVIIGKKHSGSAASVRYRRVRDREMSKFQRAYEVTSEAMIEQNRFRRAERFDLRVPDLEPIWDFCSHLPKLVEYGQVGQGFSHIGKDQPDFPANAQTVSDRKFAGSVQGFQNLGNGYTHELPPLRWLNLSANVINRRRSGTVQGQAQILINEAPVQRGPWCVRAMIDRVGRPVMSRLTVVRPLSKTISLEFFWALFNSPIGNAYAYSHSQQRDILTGPWRDLPFPLINDIHLKRVEEAVRVYLDFVTRDEEFSLTSGDVESKEGVREQQARELCWRIDAEVLKLYALPTALERMLLDYFTGWERPSVPFQQYRYLPERFDEAISLADYIAITTDWEYTNARRHKLLEAKIVKPLNDVRHSELQELQRLAGLKRALINIPMLTNLRKIESDLRKRGAWKDL